MSQTFLSPSLLNQDAINAENPMPQTSNSLPQDLLSPTQNGSIMVVDDTAPDARGNPSNGPHELEPLSPELYSQASQMFLSTPRRHLNQHGRRCMTSDSMLNLRKSLSSAINDPPTPPLFSIPHDCLYAKTN